MNSNNKIKAVIFDLDGTLIDSEPNYYEADKKLLAEYGIFNFTQEMKKQYVGIGTRDMMQDIREKYGIADTIESLIKKKNEYYIETAKTNTIVFPEMRKFLKILNENKYPMAIASGSSLEIINTILSITDLSSFFGIRVSAEVVEKGKPEPDLFIEAAKQISILPENCLVIEDSQYGVEAAKKASMYCIAIPYLIKEGIANSFMMADLLINQGISYFSAEKTYEWLTSI
jgi:beta-phosphoglucomutase family hydrolase